MILEFDHLNRIHTILTQAKEKIYVETGVRIELSGVNIMNYKSSSKNIVSDVSRIATLVTNYTGITMEEISGKLRTSSIVLARMAFCYLARKYVPNISLSEIGRQINRDHTTIIHALDKIETYIKERSNKIIYKIEDIEDALGNMEILVDQMPNSTPNDAVSDTTGDDSSNQS